MDALPGGVFYAGFAGAGFVGAVVATAHSDGASVAEASIAAVFVGILHLGILLFGGTPSTGILPQLAEPLSTTFVCFAGAFAGGKLAVRPNNTKSERESASRLATTAILVLVGAAACHASLLVILETVSTPLALSLGIFLFFTTPAIAGYAMQLTTRNDVTSGFAYGIGAASIVFVALLMLQPQSFTWNVLCKGILFSSLLALTGGFTFVLCLPGILWAQTSKRRAEQRARELPQAYARAVVPPKTAARHR